MISTPDGNSPSPNRQSGAGGPAGGPSSAAGETAATAKSEFSRTTEDLRRQGAEFANTAREQARSFADEQKNYGADRIHGLADAVNKAADDLENSSPQLARYARQAASSVDEWSSTLRSRSVGDIISSATEMARREPVAFFGAAMVAGFAVSRLLKSSEDRRADVSGMGEGGYPSGQPRAGSASMPYGTTTATGPAMTSTRPGATPGFPGGAGPSSPAGR